jgi:hypothetical protein
MALPSLQQVKDRLRIEHDVEDDDLTLMMASALATITEAVGRPLTATERTFTIECPASLAYPYESYAPACHSFFLPLYPVDPDSVTIEDVDEVALDEFRVNGITGQIRTTGSAFSNFPLTVTADVGLDLMDDYATRVEPKLAQAFLDLCADWYQRRNPGALAEGAGGGVITQWQTLGVPERIRAQLSAFRLAKAH